MKRDRGRAVPGFCAAGRMGEVLAAVFLLFFFFWESARKTGFWPGSPARFVVPWSGCLDWSVVVAPPPPAPHPPPTPRLPPPRAHPPPGWGCGFGLWYGFGGCGVLGVLGFCPSRLCLREHRHVPLPEVRLA